MSPKTAPHAYSSRGSLRQRLTAALLAVVVAALIVLLLILSGVLPQVFVPVATSGLSTFNVPAGSRTVTPAAHPQRRQKAAAKAAPKAAARLLPPPLVPTRVSPPTGMVVLSRDEFAAADIGKIKGTAGAGTAGKADADSASTYGPGEGPGGKRLYAAEWYREPTHQELAFYMPAGLQEGWATIACRTVDRYHVEDCRVLGETPGSGIGRGLRQAAWQFLVLPPRVDGRPMVGAWVRIRFDLVRGLVR